MSANTRNHSHNTLNLPNVLYDQLFRLPLSTLLLSLRDTDYPLKHYYNSKMTVKLFNTLTRSLEEFKPQRPDLVTFYGCGPTVYNYAHIGNLRAFAFYDLLRRYLTYRGYNVKQVMNITDVDDKTIRDSQAAHQSLSEFTTFFTEAFIQDLRTLSIEIPEIMPKATEEIDGMVELIQALIDKGHAYKTDRGDIYFKISSCADYGELAGIDLTKLRANADNRLNLSDEYDKENVQDFALWKAYHEDDGEAFWETALGKGRPGWHTECSVMAAKYLELPIDIHAGGVDLCFPHHTNEIAQAECAYGGKFVNYWLHNEHLMVDGRKMSKSEGNYYTLRDLTERGIDPVEVRFELLKTHYRTTLDFRLDNMSQNRKVLAKFSELFQRLQDVDASSDWPETTQSITKAHSSFQNAMDNDLNISEGLAAIFEFVSTINRNMDSLSAADAEAVRVALRSFDDVLGFIGGDAVAPILEDEILALIEERNSARKDRDFARADEIRDSLLARGIQIKDTPDGVRWSKI